METTAVKGSNGAAQTTSQPAAPKAPEMNASERLYLAEKSIADAAERTRENDNVKRLIRGYARGDARSEALRALRPGVKASLRSVRGR